MQNDAKWKKQMKQMKEMKEMKEMKRNEKANVRMIPWFNIDAQAIVLKLLGSSYFACRSGHFPNRGWASPSSPSLQHPALPKAQDDPAGQAGTIRDISKTTVVRQMRQELVEPLTFVTFDRF